MPDPGLERALDRIEAALARIERASTRPVPGDMALARRHERLRATVAESLRDLDALLAEADDSQ